MKLYTLSALARETGVSSATLRRWRNRGWLRPYTYGGLTMRSPRYTMECFDTACMAVRQMVSPVDTADYPMTYDDALKYIAP